MNMFCILLVINIMFFRPREMVACSTTYTNTSLVPRGWDDFCTTVNSTSVYRIACSVTKQNVWNFLDYRNWVEILTDEPEVQLAVTCEENAVISLPWPYRARYLKSLSIYGCTIRNFGSEHGRADIRNISDSLQIIDITSCLIEINLTHYLSWRVKEAFPEFECGPLNVEKYIFRNVSFIIVGSEAFNKSLHVNVMDKMSEKITNSVHMEHTCDMKNLILMDLSQQRQSSPFTFENNLINSRYPKLEILNLSRSGQHEFPAALTTWRYRLVQLRTLDLSFNNISRFHVRGMGTSHSSLGMINLTHNAIRTVTEKEIASFILLDNVLIDIRYNPLLCDCSMSNFTRFLHEYETPASAGINIKYSYLWELTCSSPEDHRGQIISRLTSDELCNSDASIYVVYIAILSSIIGLLFLLIFLITRFRKEIKILAFTRLNIVLPFRHNNVKTRKQFDAFISYSYLDSKWVTQTLLPRLENSVSGPHFRLCLHQRDFAVGAAIADNIVQSIEASRHTVLVLSRNFLKSEWCLMEFRTAFHQSLMEKKNYLIPVMLENVTDSEMDSDLRRCLNTVTYIKVNDRLFWDKIIYALMNKTNQRKSGSNTRSNFYLNNDISNPTHNQNHTDVVIRESNENIASVDMEKDGRNKNDGSSSNNVHNSYVSVNGVSLVLVESQKFEKCSETSCVNFGFDHSEKVTSV